MPSQGNAVTALASNTFMIGVPSRVLLAAVAFVLGACGGSTSAPPEYVHPPSPEHGKAPGMKAQSLSGEGHDRRYAVVFAPGDEILAGLTEFAEREHLGAAQITAIGAVSDATVGFFDKEKKLYRAIHFDTQAEVTSLVGDIALFHDKPVVHAHMNIALSDGTVRGGHLLSAHVWPTLEVMVTESPHPLHKEHNEELGVDLIVPESPR